MEKPLDRQLDDIMGNPSVVGVLCTDSQGLCLGAKGNASKLSSGLISNLALQAAKLHPECSNPPTVSIESDSGTVLIKSHDEVTVAVYKVPS